MVDLDKIDVTIEQIDAAKERASRMRKYFQASLDKHKSEMYSRLMSDKDYSDDDFIKDCKTTHELQSCIDECDRCSWHLKYLHDLRSVKRDGGK